MRLAVVIPSYRVTKHILEVLAGNDVLALIDSHNGYTPTPAVSVAIIDHNSQLPHGSDSQADGIVITPSHNPPQDGGIKYNPPHGGPADSDATGWIANRANELIREGLKDVKRKAPNSSPFDFRENYVSQLDQVLKLHAIRDTGIRIGADPLGGASVDYWPLIAERYRLNLEVINPKVDYQFGFMTLDWDGKIRMDCSSEFAMASLIQNKSASTEMHAYCSNGWITPLRQTKPPRNCSTGLTFVFRITYEKHLCQRLGARRRSHVP